MAPPLSMRARRQSTELQCGPVRSGFSLRICPECAPRDQGRLEHPSSAPRECDGRWDWGYRSEV